VRIRYIALLLILTMFAANYLYNQSARPLILMATTTTRDSGLLDKLIPALENDTALDIEVVAFGTGKVLRSAIDGNADIIMVHDPHGEKIFMEEGYGKERLPIMQNDFVIIGPMDDPAHIASSTTAAQAFSSIAGSNSAFVSRGDDSGTHKAEMRIWQSTKLKPKQFVAENYILTGAGMGRTLNIAVEKSAYSLTDRATWLTFQNKGNLKILFDKDDMLENIYSIITVNPERHPHISPKKQLLVLNWFKSEKSKSVIRNYKKNGVGLYHPFPDPEN